MSAEGLKKLYATFQEGPHMAGSTLLTFIAKAESVKFPDKTEAERQQSAQQKAEFIFTKYGKTQESEFSFEEIYNGIKAYNEAAQ